MEANEQLARQLRLAPDANNVIGDVATGIGSEFMVDSVVI